jgi:phage protein D
MTRRTRTFEQASDRQVFELIAREHALQAEIDLDGPTYPLLAQVNQSDLAFLHQRARLIGAEVWVSGDTLHAQSRLNRDAGTVTLSYGAELLDFRVLADLDGQSTELAVNGWDVARKTGLQHAAGQAAIQDELAGGQSGASLLADAFGLRIERLVHLNPQSQDETEQLAEAQFRARARRFITGCGLCGGDAHLRVGAQVDLQGLGPLFEGFYYVTAVRHKFDDQQGYRTEFWVQRPGLGQP